MTDSYSYSERLKLLREAQDSTPEGRFLNSPLRMSPRDDINSDSIADAYRNPPSGSQETTFLSAEELIFLRVGLVALLEYPVDFIGEYGVNTLQRTLAKVEDVLADINQSLSNHG